MPNCKVHNFNDLPLVLKVEDLSKILGVSRRVAYRIAKTESLAIRVGDKRLVVPRQRLLDYLNRPSDS